MLKPLKPRRNTFGAGEGTGRRGLFVGDNGSLGEALQC